MSGSAFSGQVSNNAVSIGPPIIATQKEELKRDGPLQHLAQDLEKREEDRSVESVPKASAFKNLDLLNRFLALWILLAMAIGVVLGNFVEETGSALQKGKFVGVSIPIDAWDLDPDRLQHCAELDNRTSLYGMIAALISIFKDVA
ncbi:MAG: hypothetical protein LQ343_000418 [Gyalolechia ehrenbergii]|nr:MAG: hypothetical protein LQ343_000418 [Gyalolechia ehrenbergii]